MRTFEVLVNCDNAAFADDERVELQRILAKLAATITDGAGGGVIRDHNGAAVGRWAIARH